MASTAIPIGPVKMASSSSQWSLMKFTASITAFFIVSQAVVKALTTLPHHLVKNETKVCTMDWTSAQIDFHLSANMTATAITVRNGATIRLIKTATAIRIGL